MNSTSTWLTFFIALACAIAAGYIAKSKNRSVIMWGIIAFIVPLIGLIIIAVIPNKALTA
jgi:hypothetical protein